MSALVSAAELAANYVRIRDSVRSGALNVEEGTHLVRAATATDGAGTVWGITENGQWWSRSGSQVTMDADPELFVPIPDPVSPGFAPAPVVRAGCDAGVTAGTPPPRRLGWAIAAVLTFWPFGVVALIRSSQVGSAFTAGEPARAVRASVSVRRWAFAAFAVCAAVMAAVVAVFVTVGLQLSSMSMPGTVDDFAIVTAAQASGEQVLAAPMSPNAIMVRLMAAQAGRMSHPGVPAFAGPISFTYASVVAGDGVSGGWHKLARAPRQAPAFKFRDIRVFTAFDGAVWSTSLESSTGGEDVCVTWKDTAGASPAYTAVSGKCSTSAKRNADVILSSTMAKVLSGGANDLLSPAESDVVLADAAKPA